MSAPSSAKINASKSVAVRTTKRDVNVNASRSRVFGASSISNSSRKVNGTGGSAGGNAQSARVYLDGVDVTPQSLLVSRIKPSTATSQRSGASKGKGGASATRRSKHAHSGSGSGTSSSVLGASVILSNSSVSSVDDSSDTDAPGGSSSTNTSGGTAAPRGSGAAAKAPPTGASTSVKSGAAAASGSLSGLPVPVTTPASTNQTDNTDTASAGLKSAVPIATSEPKTSSVSTDMSASMAVGLTPSTASTGTTTTTAATTGATLSTPSDRVRRRPITIELAETATHVVFELRSVCVSADASCHAAVAARNRQYLDACAAKRGSDKFVNGRSQTLQLAQKGKEVMTAPPATRDVMCAATDWDIYDCARIEEDNQNEPDDSSRMDATTTASAVSSGAMGATDNSNNSSKSSRTLSEYESGDAQLKHQVDEIVDATLVSPGCVLDVDGDIVADLRARQHARTRRSRHPGGARSRTRYIGSSATQSQLDVGRSRAHNSGGTGNSSSSMASVSQSGAALSFGEGGNSSGGVDSGNNSSASLQTTSQAGVTSGSASHGVLSGGDSSGDDNNQSGVYARAANANVDIGATIAQQRTAKVLASQSLCQTASVVERAVQQNVFHAQHVLYRNFPLLADPLDAMRNDTTGLGSGVGSSDAAGHEALEKLWTFECELTADRRVTCVAWNTVNDDLLAVSYGHVERRDVPADVTTGSSGIGLGGSISSGVSQSVGPGAPLSAASPATSAETASGGSISSDSDNDGLILFWSLTNPEYPERIYHLGVSVTSIAFSGAQPYLLAVGFVNGVVAIYDTRKDDAVVGSDSVGGRATRSASTAATVSLTSVRRAPGLLGSAGAASTQQRLHTPMPVATSDVSPGKHLDVLWQVKWISKGADRSEHVVTIGGDGRVTEWSMAKGLSYSDLMTLKRIANPLLGSDARADGVLSRQASGHCIDFVRSDPSVYFVGTDDGLIHKCSVSYNEQYLETYVGHTGPVYALVVSPFCSDVVLSCSGDWTIKLWHAREAALTCRSNDLAHAVHSVAWCPSDATLFSAVTEDGRIEIWDLAQSTLDPVITHFPLKYARNAQAAATTTAAVGITKAASLGLSTDASLRGDIAALNSLDDPLVPPSSSIVSPERIAASQAIALECTTIAFAPSAPVIVVGDSTGDVTVYRVPTLAAACMRDTLSADEQVAKLMRSMYPNKQQG